jgi:hypothetical protein
LMAEASKQSEDDDGGVEIQSGGESNGRQQGEKLGRRDVENVEHFLKRQFTTEAQRNIWFFSPRLCGESYLLVDRESQYPFPEGRKKR